jgi:hypothetical protein
MTRERLETNSERQNREIAVSIFTKLKSLDSAEEIKRTELNAVLEEFLLTKVGLPSCPVIRIAAG